MNSYNDNLHSSVVKSLSDQESALNNAEAQLEASIFSLYYAQGAYITAYENLEVDNRSYVYKQNVNKAIIRDSDISTNVLASANQGNTHVAQSISDTAVAAANVQIATNAIVKLASDVGSIYSIVNAADFDTEIYDQAYDAYALMNDTAYLAERTSEKSMLASSYVAEVSASTVAEKAASTDASVKNLLSVLDADFKAISEKLAVDNTNLAAASVNEKVAEGKVEDLEVVNDAAKEGYDLSNKELNLDLVVSLSTDSGMHNDVKVSFEQYTSPFPTTNPTTTDSNGNEIAVDGYPVEAYYIMVVSESKKNIFAISDAEGLITNADTSRFVKVAASGYSPGDPINETLTLNGDGALKDSDGNPISLGDNYVVFVLAVLETGYKKAINNFDDYITAPSAVFALTNQLKAPKAKSIKVTAKETAQDSISLKDGSSKTISVEKQEGQTLGFSIKQIDTGDKALDMQYRCMFLPDNSEFVKGLLTNQKLKDIEHYSEKESSSETQKELSQLKKKIEELTGELNKEEGNDDISNLLEVLNSSIEGKSENEIETLKKSLTGWDSVLDKFNLKKIANKEEAKVLELLHLTIELEIKEIQLIENAVESTLTEERPGFFFNLDIAEQVSAGNYILASPSKKNKTNYSAEIIDGTTDNFGNRLIPGNKYIPVVLAISGSDDPDEVQQFTAALSNFANTNSFYYNYEINS